MGKVHNLDVVKYTIMINRFHKRVCLKKHLPCFPDFVTYEIILHALFKRVENDKLEGKKIMK